MEIPIGDLTNASSALAGTVVGKALFGALVAQVARTRPGEVVVLDFSGVEIATASFLREAVLAFRDYVRRPSCDLYVVLANCSPDVEEELQFICDQMGDGILLSDGKRVRFIGTLNEREAEALDVASRRGSVTARHLVEEANAKDGQRPGRTGWNNVLAQLASKGLLKERQLGRGKHYESVRS